MCVHPVCVVPVEVRRHRFPETGVISTRETYRIGAGDSLPFVVTSALASLHCDLFNK